MTSFFALEPLIMKLDPSFHIDGDSLFPIYSTKSCSDVSLPPLNFSIGTHSLPVPQEFLLRDTVNKQGIAVCSVLISWNKYQDKSPVVLGQPFIQAYSLFLDFADN